MAEMQTERTATKAKRALKPLTGAGAGLVSFGVLVALTSGGDPMLVLGLLGALLLGVGIATEWRD